MSETHDPKFCQIQIVPKLPKKSEVMPKEYVVSSKESEAINVVTKDLEL